MAVMLPKMPEQDCTREGYLRERDEMRQWEKDMEECRRKRRWAGYERLKNTKYKEGENYAVRWMS